MTDQPVLIAGAGIGGLTAALALSRLGESSIIIEQRTKVDEIGAGIQLSPNASRILIELGLGNALQKAAAEPRHLIVRSGRSGQELAAMALGERMRQAYGAPYYTIHRADLQTILLDAVRGTGAARLAFGRTVAAIEENSESGVRIRCDSQSASEAVNGKALIGADGLWSGVARLIGDDTRPEFRRHVAWRGLVPRENWPNELTADDTVLWLGPSAHLVHYPIRRGAFINLVAISSDRDNEPGWSRPGDAKKLLKRFAAWPVAARRALETVSDWTLWSLYDRPPRPVWQDRRVALLGDAAHPVLPFLAQGGALAMEDAAILAREWAISKDDPARSFAAYAAQRIERATRVQAAARRNGEVYHLPWPLSFARDLAMKRMDISARYDWIYAWR
jgi:salicylate hydroxylase